ncbi:ubiquitin-protein ligase [Pelomyxa schiedti]|nr:ubiquitin-protein ligase [Pelomyxa schiedti]
MASSSSPGGKGSSKNMPLPSLVPKPITASSSYVQAQAPPSTTPNAPASGASVGVNQSASATANTSASATATANSNTANSASTSTHSGSSASAGSVNVTPPKHGSIDVDEELRRMREMEEEQSRKFIMEMMEAEQRAKEGNQPAQQPPQLAPPPQQQATGTPVPPPLTSLPDDVEGFEVIPPELVQDGLLYQKSREDEERASQQAILALLREEAEEERRRKAEESAQEEAAFKLFIQQEQRARQAELDAMNYPCAICGDSFKIDNIYILEECFHKFCVECLEGHFTTQITDGNVREIKCPHPTCKHVISYAEVRHIVKNKDFDKFDTFLLKSALDEDPNCRWCPRGCGSAMIGTPLSPMMRCPNPKCNFCFCFNCRDEWHSDATCAQYQQWKKDNSEADAKFAKWAAEHTKVCPKCKTNIEKNGGCNHMTCKKCKHEFCWLCFGDYKPGHFNTGPCNGKQFT